MRVPLLRKFLNKGKILCKMPSVEEIQRYHCQQVNLLPPKFKDLDFAPEVFPVIYSEKLEATIHRKSLKGYQFPLIPLFVII